MRTPVFVTGPGAASRAGRRYSCSPRVWPLPGCGRKPEEAPKVSVRDDATAGPRARMVETQIVARGVRDPRVLAAMRKVPRHLFVAPRTARSAYEDQPVPIGGQADDFAAVHRRAHDRAPRAAAGSPACSRSARARATRAPSSASSRARSTRSRSSPSSRAPAGEKLRGLGYANVVVREGDGYRGWPEQAPFDGIIVTAAPERIPAAAARAARARRPHGDSGRAGSSRS